MATAKNGANLLASLIGACVVGYFLYHTIQGSHGWVAQVRLQNELQSAHETLVRLQNEREALDRRVHLLRPESLDPDLLDEEARKALNYSKPNEIVILSSSSGATTR